PRRSTGTSPAVTRCPGPGSDVEPRLAPRDGRIVELGLSTRTDPNLGNHVALHIHAASPTPG
ncbi:hypothetical protein ACWEPL_53475, partial [Nonomuraea sp. NPDC004186]